MASVLVPLANGFEEIEAITIIDLLRRADIDVTVAALEPGIVHGAHGIDVEADTTLDDALTRDYDMAVLPGGLPGSDNLQNDRRVRELLKKMANSGRFTAAICAAPKVLAASGVLEGRIATSYPGVLENFKVPGMRLSTDPVVQDGKVITSRGPGTAMDFALTLIEQLAGEAKRDQIEASLMRPRVAVTC